MRKLNKTQANKKKQHFKDNASHVAYARRMRVFMRRGFMVVSVMSVLILCGGMYWLWHSGIINRYTLLLQEGFYQQTARAGLVLENVYLEGDHYAEKKSILSALDVSIGQPILSIPIHHIRRRLEQLDWVQYAIVDRQLPHTLHIRIVERTPIAIWQNNRQFYLVDTEGRVIVAEHVERFSKLMVMVGDDAPLYTPSLLALIQSEPELAKNVNAAIRVGERRWNIRFKNGTEVMLPEENQEASWHFLQELNKKKQVLNGKRRSVDLRVPGKIYMKPAQDSEKKI